MMPYEVTGYCSSYSVLISNKVLIMPAVIKSTNYVLKDKHMQFSAINDPKVIQIFLQPLCFYLHVELKM